jgi:outer membrane protein OmpA-like peptidoglycan-associated protein
VHMFRLVRNSLLVVTFVLSFTVAVTAEDMSAEDIIGSLKASAQPSGSDTSAEDVIASLKASIAVVARESGHNASKSLAVPALDGRSEVNIEIFFDYNSAAIKTESIPSLIELGKALQSPALSGNRFLVAGHTDAAGSRQYNMVLSAERAEAVKTFLKSAFPDAGNRVFAIGFGEERISDSADPNGAKNRRVQIVNIGK